MASWNCDAPVAAAHCADDFRSSDWRQGRPPVPAAGQRPPPLALRPSSADGGRAASPASSTSMQRRSSTQALLNQLSAFAQDLHETHTVDISDLKRELEDSENLIKALLDEEVQERQEADKSLETRCDSLERELALLRKQLTAGNGLGQQRIDNLENSFAAWADKHTRDIESLCKSREAFGRELATFNAAHEQHLQVEQSLDTAVKGLTSAAQQTAKALAAAKAKVDQVHENVLSCEQHCVAEETKTSALGERLREVERRFEHSTSNHSKDLELLRDDHQSLSIQVKQKISDANDLIAQHAASQKAHADTQEESRTRDLKCLRDENRKQGQDLSLMRQQVEKALERLAQTTTRELKASRDDLDQILGLLCGVQKAWRPCTSRGNGLCKKRLSDESSPKMLKEGCDLSINFSRSTSSSLTRSTC